MGLQQVDVRSLNPVLNDLKAKTAGCRTMDETAQRTTRHLFESFKDEIVLARMFATVPYGKLPAANQAFVAKLAKAQNITALLDENTAILSLVGTSGHQPAWNDRRKSDGHVGIPLASADFVDRIPMVSRLLDEVGLGLDWLSRGDTNIVVRASGRISGVFFVPDAATATDDKGRKIISAQEFVKAHGVRSVFGVAGAYAIGGTFVVLIVFTNQALTKGQAELFTPVINIFKGNTGLLASSGAIFSH